MTISITYLELIILFGSVWIALTSVLIKKYLIPYLTKKNMKAVAKNPQWIVKDIKKNYYGFNDIDVVLFHGKHFKFISPQMYMTKDNRFEFYIPEDFVLLNTNTVTDLMRIAIIGKIYMKHNINLLANSIYADKSLLWLSILCYMLDGGKIDEKDVSWESKKQ